MRKHVSFFLLFCFTVLSTPFATPEVDAKRTFRPAIPEADDACNLPAPASFYVLSVGTNYITVAWSPVSGASQYRMKVRDLTASVDVSDQLVGSLVFTQTGLADGHNYEFKVFPVCPSGEQSEAFARLEQRTIVIDLVLEASNYNSTPQYNCHGGFSSSPVTCNFNYQTGYEFWLEVRHTTMDQRARYKARVESNGHVTIGLVSPISGNYQLLYALETRNEDGLSPLTQNDVLPSSQVFVNAWGGTACSLTMSVNGTTGTVIASPTSNYEFWVLNPSQPPAGGGSGGGLGSLKLDRNETEAASSSPIGVSSRQALVLAGKTTVVNPFSTTLQALLPAPADTPVTLQLFSLDGRLQTQQQFPAGATRCSLPTADLPNGMYLLRVESRGQTDTFKVIKTE